MSVETILEKYPLDVELKDAFHCTLRPLEPGDEVEFLRFFGEVPEGERLFIKHRVDDPAVIQGWCADPDYDHKLPLVAIHDGRIVGCATLHQNLGGWKRHLGRVSVLVLPRFRGRGLARRMVEEIVEVARHAGLDAVEAEFLARQEAAIKMFGLLGFEPLVRIPDYVMDNRARKHDYLLMTYALKTPEEFASAG